VAEEGTTTRPKIAQMTTVAASINGLMRGWLRYLGERGAEVHTICAPGPELAQVRQREAPACTHEIPMTRRITPWADLTALWRLVKLLRRERFDLLHASTPKGGLLGMLAAWLARVPARVFTLRGLPLTASTGLKRRILWWSDWLTMRLAHCVTAISPSLRDEAVALGLCRRERIRVIHLGSSNGIDTRRFARTCPTAEAPLRRTWGLPPGALAVGFIGRIVRDKGVIELADAWERVRREAPDARLVLVGPTEPQDPVPPEILDRLQRDERVVFAGWHDDTVPCFEALDLLVLPTYREGFGNVLLEAGAMELPVIATRVAGCIDAVVAGPAAAENGRFRYPPLAGETGLLVPVRDSAALAEAILTLLNDPERRRRMGRAGRTRAVRDFSREVIWEGYIGLYRELLEQARRPTIPAAPVSAPAESARERCAAV
jgi:glycosyltransferase involved in cell wall biosynthesis